MIFLLYNPKAGNGRAEEIADRIRSKEQSSGIESINILDENGAYSFMERVRQEDSVYLVGGDGTLNRFINAAGDLKALPEIFFYPAGTGNDLKNDIDPDNISDRIRINDYFGTLPTVIVNGREYRFFNGIGFGIDGYCCEEGDKIRARSDKPVNYTRIAIMGLLGKYKPRNAKVTVDGVTKEYKRVWLAPAMLGKFYGGGMMVTPGQDRSNKEHTLTCAVMSGAGKLKTLIRFPKIFTGRHIKYTDMMHISSGHEITVEFDTPCALQIDGETFLDVKGYTARYF